MVSLSSFQPCQATTMRGGAVDVQIVFVREEAAMTVRFVFLLHVLLLYRSYLAAKDRVPCETLIAPLWRPCVVVVVVVVNSVDVSYCAQCYTYSDAFSTTLNTV